MGEITDIPEDVVIISVKCHDGVIRYHGIAGYIDQTQQESEVQDDGTAADSLYGNQGSCIENFLHNIRNNNGIMITDVHRFLSGAGYG